MDLIANGLGDLSLGLSSWQLWTLLLDLHVQLHPQVGIVHPLSAPALSCHLDCGIVGTWAFQKHPYFGLLCVFAFSSHCAVT